MLVLAALCVLCYSVTDCECVVASSSTLRGGWERELIQACNLSEEPPPPFIPQFVSHKNSHANEVLLIILLSLRIDHCGISNSEAK